MALRDDGPYWHRSATDKASLVADVIGSPKVSYGKMGIKYAISEQVQRRSEMENWVVQLTGFALLTRWQNSANFCKFGRKCQSASDSHEIGL